MRARDNPYRVERVHGLAFRLTGANWDGLWRRFQHLGNRACVLGPHGSGKTTFLSAFAAMLRESGFAVRQKSLAADDRFGRREADLWRAGLDDRNVLILDGADLLSPKQWRRVQKDARCASGLLVSCHARPLLPVLHRCRTTTALLEDLMRELHPANGCGQPGASELFARHRGDLREALRELYDFHAEIRGGGACR